GEEHDAWPRGVEAPERCFEVAEVADEPGARILLEAREARHDHRHIGLEQYAELRLDRGVGLRRQHADQAAGAVVAHAAIASAWRSPSIIEVRSRCLIARSGSAASACSSRSAARRFSGSRSCMRARLRPDWA